MEKKRGWFEPLRLLRGSCTFSSTVEDHLSWDTRLGHGRGVNFRLYSPEKFLLLKLSSCVLPPILCYQFLCYRDYFVLKGNFAWLSHGLNKLVERFCAICRQAQGDVGSQGRHCQC